MAIHVKNIIRRDDQHEVVGAQAGGGAFSEHRHRNLVDQIQPMEKCPEDRTPKKLHRRGSSNTRLTQFSKMYYSYLDLFESVINAEKLSKPERLLN